MTHILRPAFRRTTTAMTLAVLMTIGTLAPAVTQAAPAAASATTVASPVTASSSLGALSTGLSATASRSAGQAAANRALSQIGSRYQWGATGSYAYDCSGLTSTAWAAAGETIPRTSRAQSNALQSISRSQLRPGDLVFFGSPVRHVEMYVGDGELVGASSSKGRVATTELRYRSNIVGYGRP